MMKGVMGQQNSYMTVHWCAFDHSPQLRSCNYYIMQYTVTRGKMNCAHPNSDIYIYSHNILYMLVQLPSGSNGDWTSEPRGTPNPQPLPLGATCRFFGCYTYSIRILVDTAPVTFNNTYHVFNFNPSSCLIGEPLSGVYKLWQ